MKASDFEFDGKKLSSFGFMICSFDEKGIETYDGTEISFNTVPVLSGQKNLLVSTQYESCLELTIQICKNLCSGEALEIRPHEHRELTKWLGRRKFLKLKILDENNIDVYFEAAFPKISKIEIDGKLIGLELNIITNSPHAFKEPRLITIVNTEIDGKHSINDISYEEGHIYPHTEIAIGDLTDIPENERNLTIHNAIENRNTHIKNCEDGEVITMDYPVIQTTSTTHNIQNDFNWNFFRIANTYEKSRNDLTISLPCTIKIKYSPIIKVGL